MAALPVPAQKSRSAQPGSLERRLPLLVLALALGIYLRTLAPELLLGDPGEFQFAAWRWGLAHPTGYPLYLILGGLWQRILGLLGLSPATALNVLSGVTGALTAALLTRLLLAWLPGSALARAGGALLAGLLLAFNPTFWSQSLIAEVYALHALFLVVILWTATVGPGRARPWIPLLLAGLALTHHRTTLFLLPGLLAWLWWAHPGWRRPSRLVGATLALALPQLLYLYIPLRSGGEASPWLTQRLDGEVLHLYAGGWTGFLDFVTGKVFAASLLSPPQALARLPQALELWQVHFLWPGLALAALGLVHLFRARRWDVLLLTLPLALIQQGFNLFYGIGDIFVFYIPLYLAGAIWAGFGGGWLLALASRGRPKAEGGALGSETTSNSLAGAAILATILLFLPLLLLVTYLPQVDRSQDRRARRMWEDILAAPPPGDALLVSNDRDEVVPLYYLQAVEGRAQGVTGLFPLITPEPRFQDVGAVVETALIEGAGRPVFLIKPMPGLEVKFDLVPGPAPLVQVTGLAAQHPPQRRVERSLGPLTLLGYDWQPEEDGGVQVALTWRVAERLDGNYTTTLQLFDAQGRKLAQDDAPPGGVFYPTSLWKPGETLREVHRLALPPDAQPARMLVGMYTGPDLTPLAPALEVTLEVALE